MDQVEAGGPGSARERAERLHDPAFSALVAHASPDMLAVIDDRAEVVWCNEVAADVLGYDREAVLGTSVLELLHPDDVELAATVLAAAAIAQPELRPARYRLKRADGTWIDVETQGSAVTLPTGEAAVIVSLRPSSQRTVDVLSSLVSGRSLDETIADIVGASLPSRSGTATVVTWHDEHGRHVSADGDPPLGLLGEGGASDAPERLAREGETVLVSDLGTIDRGMAQAARAAGFTGFVTLGVTDPGGFAPATVTQWSSDQRILELLALGAIGEPAWALRLALQVRHYRRQLEEAARTDPLTGVANRNGLFEVLERGRLGEGPVTVLFVDLDGFKPVNDAHGHAVGDQVLIATAARLRHAVRPTDVVARLGGDEFVVVCPGTADDDAAALADRVLAAVAEPMDVGGRVVGITASIGVATTEPEVLAADRLLHAADEAMYAAKRSGRARWLVADPG